MKKIPLLVAFLLCSLVFASQAFAKPSVPKPGITPSATQTQRRNPAAEFKSVDKESEQLRSELLSFVQAYKGFAGALGINGQVEVFERYERLLRELPLKQLEVLRNVLPDTSGMNAATAKLNDQVELLNKTEGSLSHLKIIMGQQSNSPPFPVADYPSCGTRTSETAIDASDVALFVAEGIRDAASRACDEVVVIVGEGGNGSLACIITDGIYVAAKIVNYGLHFCNDKIDQAELAATYNRLGHLHTDLESSVANDNANKTAIINNSNTNTANIVANDNANKTVIVNNDNANKTTIINNDNANTATILLNANANKNELRDLLLRTQIEADLAQPDSSTFVALYLTPTANGGYLNLVRTIVAQTIANIQAAGGSTGQAQSLLTQGDAAKAAGDFKGAYTLYRKAYKTAAK